jgi:molecular chaperone DnaK
VEVHVLQGERSMASENRTLARFHLEGIPPAPRGIPQVEVTFDIDANGIVHVAARDKASSTEQTVRIEAGTGLSDGDIERMVSDAKVHEEDDKERRDQVEVKNRADSLCYQVERSLQEHKDKIDEGMKQDIEVKLKATRDALDAGEVDAISSAVEELTTASHKLAEKVYQTGGEGEPGAAASAAEPQGEGSAPNAGNVVDAEFEDEGKPAPH